MAGPMIPAAGCGKPRCKNLADEFGLTITVTHFPAGASKWNPMEHRLFCFISLNWAGQPLVSYETILKFIRTTHTDRASGVRPAWTEHSIKRA